ncbi:MAG: hypothetical protein P4L35_18395, partial [Ignavibacteriaceae bacterium]|nr:hypothetical protein [Ignavibacteriaceae bacterium]
AESSVYQHDWEVFPYVMASGTSVIINKNRWHIQSPHSVLIKNFISKGNILLDGKLYPGYSREEIIIPKGEHILSFSDSAAGQSNKDNSLRLIGISDELIYCSRISNGIELVYQSPARCLFTLNKLPVSIKVDGISADLKMIKEDDRFIFFAPSGKHSMELVQ